MEDITKDEIYVIYEQVKDTIFQVVEIHESIEEAVKRAEWLNTIGQSNYIVKTTQLNMNWRKNA